VTNYPDGMTRDHWSHIDGESHYGDCPHHEDNDPLTTDECLCEQIAPARQEDAHVRKMEGRL